MGRPGDPARSAFLGELGGQAKGEDRAVIGRARLEEQLAAHGPAQLPRDIQAETAALVGRPLGAAHEPTEQPQSILLGDAWTAVGQGHAQARRRAVRGDPDRDRRAPAVLHGVVEQRPEDLVELIRIGDREPAGGPVLQAEGDFGRAERLPGLPDPSRQRDHLGSRVDRARLEPRDGQQLPDHPRQALGLFGDDAESLVGPVELELLGVRADARQRCLEAVADAAQEVVLGRVELEELRILGCDLAEQLGVADRHRKLAGEQLQEVLVRPLPGARGRQASHEHAQVFVTDPQDGSQRARFTGHDLVRRHRRRVPEDHGRIDHAKGGLGIEGSVADQEFHAVARRCGLDGGQDPAQLAIASLEVGGQAIVAVGEAGELVVAGHPDRRRQIAGRDSIHGGRDGPQRSSQVRGQEIRDEDREQHGDGQSEEQETGQARVDARPAKRRPDRENEQAERGHRQDRRQDQGEGQARPEAEAAGGLVLAVALGRVQEVARLRIALSRVKIAVGVSHRVVPEPSSTVAGTSRYPTPRTVCRCTGRFGSRSTFWRSRRIVTQT